LLAGWSCHNSYLVRWECLSTRSDTDRMVDLPLLGDRVCRGAARRSGGVLGPPDPRHHSSPRAAGAADLYSSTSRGDELRLLEPPDGTDGLSVQSRHLVELALGARTGRRLGSAPNLPLGSAHRRDRPG